LPFDLFYLSIDMYILSYTPPSRKYSVWIWWLNISITKQEYDDNRIISLGSSESNILLKIYNEL